MLNKKPQPRTLPDIVRAMEKARILVVGDVMLDRFVRGEVNRISPESPVPVLSSANETEVPGGAGNVVANLRSLGAQTSLIAVVGDDADADRLRVLFKDSGVKKDHLVTATDRPTTLKARYMAGHHHILRVDAEKNAPVASDTAAKIIAQAKSLLKDTDVLVLSDYGKGVLTPSTISELITLAKSNNVTVMVDPKKSDYSAYKGADIVTPNRRELAEAAGTSSLKTDEDIVAAAEKIIASKGVSAILATRSEDGMSVVAKDTAPLHLRTKVQRVFDVSGAGDTVVAAIAASLAAGADLADAARIANIAAGLVVAKPGTATVTTEELLSALKDPSEPASHVSWDEALAQINAWKAEGLKVGFTNGCFDIIHRGHVTYMKQARSKCDRLVLGLNADASVKRLKGPTRPVNDEDARAIVMAGLASVDLVVLFGAQPFEDDKPVRIIQHLKPDIFFKGGDYTEAQLPEAPAVRAYGGEVEIMGLVEGHSTTGTIAKLAKKA